MEERYGFKFDDLKHTESWGEFDTKYTVKTKPKFRSAAEYYLAASCLYQVKHVKKPTLVIHSKDDPIIPIDCLPANECAMNPNMIVGIVEKGGHVCYF